MKTPISLLQEICQQHHTTCKYGYFKDCEIISDELNIVFKCEVKVRIFDKGYVSYGYALNKKVAKQEAARKILLKISTDSSDVKALYEKFKSNFELFSQLKPALDKTCEPSLPSVYQSKDQNTEEFPPDDKPVEPPITPQESSSSLKPSQPKDLSDSKDDNDEMKSPVYILAEHLDSVGLTPNYISSQIDSSSPCKLFSCRLELFEGAVHVEAFGSSLHEAKMQAAKNMMEGLLEEQILLQEFLDVCEREIDESLENDVRCKDNVERNRKDEAVLPKTKETKNNKKNPISLLQEYLVQEKLSPIFVEKQISTVPPEFECKLNLYGGKYQVTSKGSNKKDAKAEAAKEMLLKIAQDKPELKEILDHSACDEESLQNCNSTPIPKIRILPVSQLFTTRES